MTLHGFTGTPACLGLSVPMEPVQNSDKYCSWYKALGLFTTYAHGTLPFMVKMQTLGYLLCSCDFVNPKHQVHQRHSHSAFCHWLVFPAPPPPFVAKIFDAAVTFWQLQPDSLQDCVGTHQYESLCALTALGQHNIKE